MNTTAQHLPGDREDTKTSGEERDEGIKISPPVDKEPVGPFEHSGEVAGWTKTDEKIEKGEPLTGKEAGE